MTVVYHYSVYVYITSAICKYNKLMLFGDHNAPHSPTIYGWCVAMRKSRIIPVIISGGIYSESFHFAKEKQAL